LGLITSNAFLRYGDKLFVVYLQQFHPQGRVACYIPHTELKIYEFVLVRETYRKETVKPFSGDPIFCFSGKSSKK
jgi:trans-aconitate methyltransferase